MNGNNYFSPFVLRCGSRLVSYDRPAVMGILNATPDSFYDGGRYTDEATIVERAEQMVREGADIVDIGVVSTRPGAVLLSPDDEARRLVAAVAAVRRHLPEAVISVDTCYALPARAAVEAGADIVNDIGGGDFDPAMFDTVAALQTPYVLMLNPYGSPEEPTGLSRIPADAPDETMPQAVKFFSQRIAQLREKGVADIIIDPGFGFSKTLQQNYSLLANLGELRTLFPTTPLLVALSRKSMIYKLLDTTPDDALTGTVALHTAALLQGAQLLRVHDVRAARHTIKVTSELISNGNCHGTNLIY